MSDFGDHLITEIRAVFRAELRLFEESLRRVIRQELRMGDNFNEMLDVNDAAKLLGLTPGALRRSIERGRFPVKVIRVGRRLRLRRGDIMDLHPERKRP